MRYDRLLDGKSAWITCGGASSCNAYARLFSRHGAKITHIGGAEPGSRGGSAKFYECDLCDNARLERLCSGLLSESGAPDVYLHVADLFAPAYIDEMEFSDLERMLEIGVLAPYAVMGLIAGPMAANGGGAAVFVAGHYGVQGMNRVSGYGAAKGAEIELARALASEYAAGGVRVNAVVPGVSFPPVADDILSQSAGDGSREFWQTVQPVWRRGGEEDLANAVLFLASDMASRVNGQALLVNGAEHLIAHNHIFPRRDFKMP